MATEFPTFVDTPEGETPEPGTPDVDATWLNAISGAVNTLENTVPGKVDAGDLADVATSGAYTDLVGAPFIPTDAADIDAQPAGDYATASELTSGLAGKANTTHAHVADDVSSGTLAIARIPTGTSGTTVALGNHTHSVSGITATGTASATTYLRGDGSWATPAGGGGGSVDSVNGETGTVVLDKSDVGLGSVDNVAASALRDRTTHTGAQAISTITDLQAALDAKADAAIAVNSQTGSAYTLVLADAGKTVEMSSAGANTLTIPPNASVALPVGTIVEVYQVEVGQTTVAAGAGVTLRAPNGAKLASQYATASLRKRATNEWVLAGDATT